MDGDNEVELVKEKKMMFHEFQFKDGTEWKAFHNNRAIKGKQRELCSEYSFTARQV